MSPSLLGVASLGQVSLREGLRLGVGSLFAVWFFGGFLSHIPCEGMGGCHSLLAGCAYRLAYLRAVAASICLVSSREEFLSRVECL